MSEKPGGLFHDAAPTDPVRRIRAAAVKVRSLRTQIGHDGLTPAGARTLLEELSASLEACATLLERTER
jgi:hypothetical protein